MPRPVPGKALLYLPWEFDMLGGVDAFVAGLVRQARRAGYIADGIKPEYVSATSRVRLDKTAV